ncbi:sugar transferase [Blautia marasmi]|uniref:sugar transferase n=1 Tax=Blautia marasmi TaxID=1917868 RepID=UPI00266D808D|nr:sugar transferase [Blautia marasmi]
MLKEWDHLPKYMQSEAVRPYYEKLKKKKISLALKRVFDVVMSTFMLIFLSPVMLIISIAVVMDSKGGVFFRQERVTQYGRKFRIFKFRTMVANADKLGSQVTVKNDMRVTKVGAVIRKYRIDELPQLINIMLGDMSYVGTRPEVTKYVKRYTPEMMATLLLPAGVTSEASIKYKDEDKLLEAAADVDEVYVKQVLPGKMQYNLESLIKFSFLGEILTMIKTVIAVIK